MADVGAGLKVGDVVCEATAFAAHAHAGQTRKGSSVPYIVHPMEVASIVASICPDESTIAAAVLHDVVEDTGADLDEIRRRFGLRVAEIVAAESEDKRRDRPAHDTWRERKQATIDHLTHTDDPSVLVVALADKLSNMRSIARDYREVGDDVWQRFNMRDANLHAWYYRAVVAALEPSLGDTCAWRELSARVEEVFG